MLVFAGSQETNFTNNSTFKGGDVDTITDNGGHVGPVLIRQFP